MLESISLCSFGAIIFFGDKHNYTWDLVPEIQKYGSWLKKTVAYIVHGSVSPSFFLANQV